MLCAVAGSIPICSGAGYQATTILRSLAAYIQITDKDPIVKTAFFSKPVEMLGFLEYVFMRPNIPFERLSLVQEIIFLAFEEVGRYLGPTLFWKRSSRGDQTRASAEPPNQGRCSICYFMRKYLWSDGGGNTIIYDHIARWGMDHLPRKSLSR